MATITEEKRVFNAAVMETPIGAVCVKKRGKTLQELSEDRYGHGVLVSPTILQGTIHNGEDDLEWRIIEINQETATVRGHGWSVFEAPFVWTATRDEFNETWVVDDKPEITWSASNRK